MRGRRLCKEKIVTLNVLASKGEPNTRIADLLGVTEGTVRYHKRKDDDPKGNAKSHKASALAEVIAYWFTSQKDSYRPVNITELYEHLIFEHGYNGSYKSVLRYAREFHDKPTIRTFRRVETPPGAQTQTDWGLFPAVLFFDGLKDMHGFIMTLSHSRKTAVVWSEAEKQLNWHKCHNESFKRLGGIPAVNRIDNLKTGISQGAGPWGVINKSYQAYAKSVGFHIDSCLPRAANAKGKVEAKVRLTRLLIDVYSRVWRDVAELQEYTDARLDQWAQKAICPATGGTVQETWLAERKLLQPLPILPEPFDVSVTRQVHRDCTVNFERHSYPVPFQYVGKRVEVRGCASTVQILAEGKVLREHARGTAERIVVDPSCYEGKPVDGRIPPPPLGRMGAKLQEIMAMPVEQRPLDLYEALSEVAR